MYSTARPREQIVEYQKGVTGANVERAVFSNDSALDIHLANDGRHLFSFGASCSLVSHADD
jgi:hypothetical protein